MCWIPYRSEIPRPECAASDVSGCYGEKAQAGQDFRISTPDLSMEFVRDMHLRLLDPLARSPRSFLQSTTNSVLRLFFWSPRECLQDLLSCCREGLVEVPGITV